MCWDLIFPIIFSVCFLCNTFNVWNRPYHTYVQILTNTDPRWPHLTEGNMKLCSMPRNIDAFHCLSIRSTLFKNTISESYIVNQTTEDCLNNLGTPHSKGISIFYVKNCTVFFWQILITLIFITWVYAKHIKRNFMYEWLHIWRF